jgi:hypothetical protein
MSDDIGAYACASAAANHALAIFLALSPNTADVRQDALDQDIALTQHQEKLGENAQRCKQWHDSLQS